MPKIARELSALEVSRLKAPGLVAVGVVPGLQLQIASSGARSWILRVKIGEKRRDMGLGAFPGVTLAQARDKARKARDLIDQGQDPVQERERTRSKLLATQSSAITFEAAARTFIDAKSAEWSNPKHLAQWTTTLETYAYPVIGKVHITDVEQAHIMQILEPIWATKTETASRIRGRLENVLDWARARGYRTGENPARWRGHLDKLLATPTRITKVKHYKAVPIESAGTFYGDLQLCEGIAAKALEFTMLTAARSGEVRGATWAEIDITAGTWVVPAARMKGKKEHRVPLSEAALRILRDAPRMTDNNLIFSAPRGGKLSDMSLTAVMRRMKVDYVPHGLRSTFRDWVAERTAHPQELAEMALAHALPNKVEAAYRRGDMLDRRRTLMEEWSAFLVQPRTNHSVESSRVPHK